MPAQLHIGLLQCGHLHHDLVPAYGDYPGVFTTFLGPHGITVTTYDVTEGLPESVKDHDAWLVSGSASSAYEPLPWIWPLEEFLRGIVDVGVPMVAVCFGHQVLAQAMGGRVEKAGAGWGAGAH